jgi:hypothetical protein
MRRSRSPERLGLGGRLLRVVGPSADNVAPCADRDGRRQAVKVARVGPVTPGDALLVRAGVAFLKLSGRLEDERGATA